MKATVQPSSKKIMVVLLCIKNKTETNPSKNQENWHTRQTIFYGKKITRWKGRQR